MNGALKLGHDKNIFRDGKFEGTRASDEANRELAKRFKVEENKFDELVKRSSEVLFRTKSVFPLDLFPTEIVVTIHKVDVIFNSFLTQRIQPVYIQNISDVFVSRGFIFSSLHIIDIGYTNHTLVIGNLKNDEALEAMKIIQGLVVSVKQNIDLTKIDSEDFTEKMKTLGAPAGSY